MPNYVASVFLYNCELWTLTKKLENTVNTFQRNHPSKILGIHWPKKITNIELYVKTKTEEWNITIQRRRLNWLGHLMRLHPETPARLALVEYLRKVKRPKERPQRTWVELIKHDLTKLLLLVLTGLISSSTESPCAGGAESNPPYPVLLFRIT